MLRKSYSEHKIRSHKKTSSTMGYCCLIVLMLYCLSAVVQPHNICYLQYNTTASDINMQSIYRAANISTSNIYGLIPHMSLDVYRESYLSLVYIHNIHAISADYNISVYKDFPVHSSDTSAIAAHILLNQAEPAALVQLFDTCAA